jgi:hypothetical protein
MLLTFFFLHGAVFMKTNIHKFTEVKNAAGIAMKNKTCDCCS